MKLFLTVNEVEILEYLLNERIYIISTVPEEYHETVAKKAGGWYAEKTLNNFREKISAALVKEKQIGK